MDPTQEQTKVPINQEQSKAGTNNQWHTDAWEGKFRYGIHSTTLAAWAMQQEELKDSMTFLANSTERENLADYYGAISKIKDFYDNMSDDDIDKAIATISNNQWPGGGGVDTPSIYEGKRSVFIESDVYENATGAQFIQQMSTTIKAYLEPTDYLIKDGRFMADQMQYNAHRSDYNNAYWIPQNSLLAVVSAYIAGLRVIELDVMETSDQVPVVIHDQLTNRLMGDYLRGPEYVSMLTADAITVPFIYTLDPLQPNPPTFGHGMTPCRIRTLEEVLRIIYTCMQELTVYVDARNTSPVSVIKLLSDNLAWRDNIVIKVYPFTLRGGVGELIHQYYSRYMGGDSYDNVWLHIFNDVKPNLLLVLGEPLFISEECQMLDGKSSFGFSDYTTNYSPLLPFSEISINSTPANNTFNGQTILSPYNIMSVDQLTYKMFSWATSFYQLGRVLILQMNLLPSLQQLRDGNHDADAIADFNSLKSLPNDLGLILSAATDNFLSMCKLLMQKKELILSNPDGLQINVGYELSVRTKFGSADRYPDFVLANRDENGRVDQSSLRHFYYDMKGLVSEKNDTYFGAKLMRSTKYFLKRVAYFDSLQLPFRYITTDLPTDLRVIQMIRSGFFESDYFEKELGGDLQFRMNSIVKQKILHDRSIDVATYVLPDWTKRYYNSIATSHPDQLGYLDAQMAQLTLQFQYNWQFKDSITIFNQLAINYDPNLTIVFDRNILTAANQSQNAWVVLSQLRLADNDNYHQILTILQDELDLSNNIIDSILSDLASKLGISVPDERTLPRAMPHDYLG